MGTGTGIIAVTVKKEMPDMRVVAVDISDEALDLAQENAKKLGAEVEYAPSNLLEIFLTGRKTLGKAICLIANLPYIKADDWENMSEDTRFEPQNALFGGEKTGFELYERLFEEIREYVAKYKPECLEVFAEFGYDQKDLADAILKKYGWKGEFFADLSGVERFVWIQTV